MIGPLRELFDVLERRRVMNESFVRLLHPERTVFLSEVIGDIRRPDRIALLDAPWLDAGRLTSRIASACIFLDKVARVDGVKGWEGMPFVFLQSGSYAEDAHQHLEILTRDSSGHYAERSAHLPPTAHYLHTRPNFSASMRGRWKHGTLVITPLTGFSTESGLRAYDRTFQPFHLRTAALGYRLTDYSRLLGVSPRVATDYFARMVVHDLCHYFLPPTPPRLEGFHNVVSLMALGRLPDLSYRDAWEGFVHAECTDPFFCMRAGREIDEVLRSIEKASALKMEFIGSLAKWYVHPNALRLRVAYWDLPADASLDLSIRILSERIRFAMNDGFRLYDRLLKHQ